MLKKVEEEVSTRAEAEADMSRLNRVIDTLQKSPSYETVRDKSKIKCRDVGKPCSCRRVVSCAFLHPALGKKVLSVTFGWQGSAGIRIRTVDTTMIL